MISRTIAAAATVLAVASGAVLDSPPTGLLPSTAPNSSESTTGKEAGTDSNATSAGSRERDCVKADPRGYLLWTGYLPEFNNQLITLSETILLNKKLKRKLVMTGFMELRDPGDRVNASDGIDYEDNATSHILHPTSFALNNNKTLSALGYTEHDWTTPEALAKVCEMRAEAHAWIHYFELPPTLPKGRIEYERSPYYVQEKIWHGEGTARQSRAIPELKKLGLQFSKAKIYVHDSQDVYAMDNLPSGKEAPMLIMDYLFYSNSNLNPPYAETAYSFYDTIHKFDWSWIVKETAHRFRKHHLGAGVKYLALHWRRGYHVAKAGTNNEQSIDISYTHEEVAHLLEKRIKSGCENCPVYIASNNLTKPDIAEIKRLMKRPNMTITSLMLHPPQQDLSTLSRAEMALCEWAHIFIPSADSTWSANVMAKRGIRLNGPPAPKNFNPKIGLKDFVETPPSSWKPHVISPPEWSTLGEMDAAAVAEKVDERNLAARASGGKQVAGLAAAGLERSASAAAASAAAGGGGGSGGADDGEVSGEKSESQEARRAHEEAGPQ